jgi:hypothetical protein
MTSSFGLGAAPALESAWTTASDALELRYRAAPLPMALLHGALGAAPYANGGACCVARVEGEPPEPHPSCLDLPADDTGICELLAVGLCGDRPF